MSITNIRYSVCLWLISVTSPMTSLRRRLVWGYELTDIPGKGVAPLGNGLRPSVVLASCSRCAFGPIQFCRNLIDIQQLSAILSKQPVFFFRPAFQLTGSSGFFQAQPQSAKVCSLPDPAAKDDYQREGRGGRKRRPQYPVFLLSPSLLHLAYRKTALGKGSLRKCPATSRQRSSPFSLHCSSPSVRRWLLCEVIKCFLFNNQP